MLSDIAVVPAVGVAPIQMVVWIISSRNVLGIDEEWLFVSHFQPKTTSAFRKFPPSSHREACGLTHLRVESVEVLPVGEFSAPGTRSGSLGVSSSAGIGSIRFVPAPG